MSGFKYWMRLKFEIGIFLVQRPEMHKPSHLPVDTTIHERKI
jgi:hypothetical protein